MSTLGVVVASLGTSVLVGIAVGLIIWRVADRIDDRQDALQRKLNRLENRFAAAGASWFAELLECAVVGDEEELARQIATMIEADDTTAFFMAQIAVPCALYAIREAAAYYPEHWARLRAAVSAAEAQTQAQTQAQGATKG